MKNKYFLILFIFLGVLFSPQLYAEDIDKPLPKILIMEQSKNILLNNRFDILYDSALKLNQESKYNESNKLIETYLEKVFTIDCRPFDLISKNLLGMEDEPGYDMYTNLYTVCKSMEPGSSLNDEKVVNAYKELKNLDIKKYQSYFYIIVNYYGLTIGETPQFDNSLLSDHNYRLYDFLVGSSLGIRTQGLGDIEEQQRNTLLLEEKDYLFKPLIFAELGSIEENISYLEKVFEYENLDTGRKGYPFSYEIAYNTFKYLDRESPVVLLYFIEKIRNNDDLNIDDLPLLFTLSFKYDSFLDNQYTKLLIDYLDSSKFTKSQLIDELIEVLKTLYLSKDLSKDSPEINFGNILDIFSETDIEILRNIQLIYIPKDYVDISVLGKTYNLFYSSTQKDISENTFLSMIRQGAMKYLGNYADKAGKCDLYNSNLENQALIKYLSSLSPSIKCVSISTVTDLNKQQFFSDDNIDQNTPHKTFTLVIAGILFSILLSFIVYALYHGKK